MKKLEKIKTLNWWRSLHFKNVRSIRGYWDAQFEAVSQISVDPLRLRQTREDLHNRCNYLPTARQTAEDILLVCKAIP